MCTGINNYRIKIRYEVVKDTRNTYIIERLVKFGLQERVHKSVRLKVYNQ